MTTAYHDPDAFTRFLGYAWGMAVAIAVFAAALSSCDAIPVLAEVHALDTADQRRVLPDSLLVDSLLVDSLTEIIAWVDLGPIPGNHIGAISHPDSGAMYNDPIGPWPCRWIRSEREVPAPCDCQQETVYTVRNGVAHIYEVLSVCYGYHTQIIIDSIWHCDGDGVFER